MAVPKLRNDRARKETFVCAALFVALTILCSVAGCGGKPLKSSKVHSITLEFSDAAQKAGGPGTRVIVHSGEHSSARDRIAGENLVIQLPDTTKLSVVEAALARVAARHKLSRIPEPAPEALSAADYFFAGRRTHFIRIEARGPRTASAWPKFSAQPGHAPKLAIIMDDMGGDLNAAKALLEIPAPLTFSILPDQPHSAEVAGEAHERGDEVMLHLPMEFMGHTAPSESAELRVGMDAAQLHAAFARMASEVPYITGVNNHEGSRATADLKLMSLLMPDLRARHLFFVDSRTTASTVAYEAAKRAGVKAASRNVFLDDVETRSAILRQLGFAIEDARRNGSAIAIGHPHPATVAALKQGLAQVNAKGVRLVFASEVVH